MKKWFEIKLKFHTEKCETPTLLIQARDIHHAENVALKFYSQQAPTVIKSTVSRISAVTSLDSKSTVWYQIKATLITDIEGSYKQKKSTCFYLVKANSVKLAYDAAETMLEDAKNDCWFINAIGETPILEVLIADQL